MMMPLLAVEAAVPITMVDTWVLSQTPEQLLDKSPGLAVVYISLVDMQSVSKTAVGVSLVFNPSFNMEQTQVAGAVVIHKC